MKAIVVFVVLAVQGCHCADGCLHRKVGPIVSARPTHLNVRRVALAGRMTAFANDLRAALGAFTVSAAEVLALLRDATTGGVLTLLWIRHWVLSLGYASGIQIVRCR